MQEIRVMRWSSQLQQLQLVIMRMPCRHLSKATSEMEVEETNW